MPDPKRTLTELRLHADQLGLDLFELWLKCYSCGIVFLDIVELDAYLHEALHPSSMMHMVIDHAIWEIEHFDAPT